MTHEKLQLIVTAKVSAKHKEKWLRWWNKSKLSRQEYSLPSMPAWDNNLRVWIDQVAFWVVVSLFLNHSFSILVIINELESTYDFNEIECFVHI